MSNKSFFWGSLFVSIGVTMFAIQRHWLAANWHSLQDLWAILLILWGVSLLINKQSYRWVVLLITGAFAGFLVTTAVYSDWTDECNAWHIHGNHSSGHFHDWNWDNDDEKECNDENCEDKNCDKQHHQSDSTNHKQQDTTSHKGSIY